MAMIIGSVLIALGIGLIAWRHRQPPTVAGTPAPEGV